MKAFTVNGNVTEGITISKRPYPNITICEGIIEENMFHQLHVIKHLKIIPLGLKDFSYTTEKINRASIIFTKERNTQLIVAERPYDRDGALVLISVAVGNIWSSGDIRIKPCPFRKETLNENEIVRPPSFLKEKRFSSCQQCKTDIAPNDKHPNRGHVIKHIPLLSDAKTQIISEETYPGIPDCFGRSDLKLVKLQPGAMIANFKKENPWDQVGRISFLLWDGKKIKHEIKKINLP